MRYEAQFLYGKELPASLSTTLRPDAALIVTSGEKTSLTFFEADCGTEGLISPTAYSLVAKLREYAKYFDSQEYVRDFLWAGHVRGFRVAVVLTSAGRLTNLQRLLMVERLDFVLLATMTDIVTTGLSSRIWRSHNGVLVDIFGRS